MRISGIHFHDCYNNLFICNFELCFILQHCFKMDKHMALLGKLCRISQKTSNEKMLSCTGTDEASGVPYILLLHRIYKGKVDITKDVDEIHPKHFCPNYRKTIIYHSQIRNAELQNEAVTWLPIQMLTTQPAKRR